MLKRRGFSLIELMIAMALGSIISVALGMIFVQTTKAKQEMNRFGEQVENGRFAMDYLAQEVALAGFWGALEVASVAAPSSLPDACATLVADLATAVPVHVQGSDGSSALSCLPDYKADTDVLVVRRASTCAVGVTGCDATQAAGVAYFQASYCTPPATRLDGTNGVVAQGDELGADSTLANGKWYKVSADAAALTLHKIDCGNTAVAGAPNYAERRRYITRIFYVTNSSETGDNIPALKMAELNGSSWTYTTVVSGIEQFQVEYGLDADGNGLADSYSANPSSVANWLTVVAVKLHVLARSTSYSPDYVDTKSYVLGGNTYGPFSATGNLNRYRRSVFTETIKLTSPASRRGG